MRKPSLWTALLVGALLAAALTATLFFVDAVFGLPLVPYDILDTAARRLPPALITFGIDSLVSVLTLVGVSVADAAKPAEQLMALGGFFTLLTGLTVAYFALANAGRHVDARLGGVGLGLLAGLLLVVAGDAAAGYGLVEAVLALALFVGWGLGVAFAHDRLTAEPPAESASQAMTVEQVDRRQFLVRLGATTAAITVVGAGVSLVRGGRREAILSLEGPADDSDAAANTFRPADISGPEVELPNAGATVEPVPGTRPEYTPIEDHYRIDINTRPVVIDEDDWRLEITGMVDNPLMLQLSDLVENYEAREQFVTLSCISNRIGGDLISTTLWTGASLREVLADAGVQGGARYLFIESEDGFFESVDLEMVMNDERIMLAYAWDRKPLEDEHGFPLRIWIPDRYGMKQPKWIQRITVTDEYQQGYWVVRNWSEEARVKATSVVDTVAEAIETENGTIVPVGGIAYAGERGISRVQVRVNDGEWQDAEVREALADTTWAIWRFEWPFQPGRHKFEVRCYDGSGQMQILETTDNRPDGATGIHSLNASVSSPG